MSQPVFRSMLAPGQSHYPIHLVLVTLEHRDRVSEHQEIGVLELAFGRSLQSALGFGEAIEEIIAPRKIAVPENKGGIGAQSSSGRSRSLFQIVLSHGWKVRLKSLGTWRPFIAWIGLKPQLEGLVRFLQVSGHLPVVVKVDEESLPLAHAIPQLPSFCGALSG